jgi:hypothetical protein
MNAHEVLDWQDIAAIGSLSEEMAEEEKARERLRKEVEPEELLEGDDEKELE